MKIQTEVFVPVLGESFDVLLPQNLLIKECLDLVARSIQDISEGLFVASEEVELYYRISGVMVDINQSVEKSGIMNGTQLMLI